MTLLGDVGGQFTPCRQRRRHFLEMLEDSSHAADSDDDASWGDVGGQFTRSRQRRRRFLETLEDNSHPAGSDDDYDDLSTQLDDVSRPQNTSAGWPLILTCDCYLLRPREGFEVLQQRVCLSAGVSCTVYSVQILRTFPSITRYLCQ